MQVNRLMKEKGIIEVKGPIEVNFKHGGGQKHVHSLCSRTYPLLSHFRNDGATVEYVVHCSRYS